MNTINRLIALAGFPAIACELQANPERAAGAGPQTGANVEHQSANVWERVFAPLDSPRLTIAPVMEEPYKGKGKRSDVTYQTLATINVELGHADSGAHLGLGRITLVREPGKTAILRIDIPKASGFFGPNIVLGSSDKARDQLATYIDGIRARYVKEQMARKAAGNVTKVQATGTTSDADLAAMGLN